MKMKKAERTPLYTALLLIIGLLSFFFLFKPADPFSDPMKDGLIAYQKKDYKKALVHFKIADNMKIHEASFALGAMYYSGTGVDVDIPKALSYYHKAAEGGYPPALTTLAILYMNGKNVQNDPEKAVFLAEKAAEQNDVEAQMLLAGWYENGTFVEQDVPEAVRYYEAAARNGNIDAKMALSIIYKNGKGTVTANPYVSKRWADSIRKQQKLKNLFGNRPADYIENVSP